MMKLYRGPYIDASCQDWFHLAQWFQMRRLKCDALTDDDGRRRRTTDDGRFMVKKAHPEGSGSGELKMSQCESRSQYTEACSGELENQTIAIS